MGFGLGYETDWEDAINVRELARRLDEQESIYDAIESIAKRSPSQKELERYLSKESAAK